MEHTEKTIAGTWYTITCTAAATVTQEIDGETVELATLTKSGTTAFRATASTITIETEGKYHILPTKAPAALGIGNNSGGDTTAQQLLYQTTTTGPAGTTEDNYDSYGFVCVAKKSGIVTGLDIACRASGNASPANTPIYIKIWRGTTELLARSSNAQTHAVASTLTYTFEPFDIAAGDELRVTYHTEDGLATTAWQMGVICCQRAVALTEGETGGMLNSQGGYSSTQHIAKHTWHMLIPRFTPATHTADTTAHLNAEEHSGLAELLARKDALLALLNT